MYNTIHYYTGTAHNSVKFMANYGYLSSASSNTSASCKGHFTNNKRLKVATAGQQRKHSVVSRIPNRPQWRWGKNLYILHNHKGLPFCYLRFCAQQLAKTIWPRLFPSQHHWKHLLNNNQPRSVYF